MPSGFANRRLTSCIATEARDCLLQGIGAAIPTANIGIRGFAPTDDAYLRKRLYFRLPIEDFQKLVFNGNADAHCDICVDSAKSLTWPVPRATERLNDIVESAQAPMSFWRFPTRVTVQRENARQQTLGQRHGPRRQLLRRHKKPIGVTHMLHMTGLDCPAVLNGAPLQAGALPAVRRGWLAIRPALRQRKSVSD